jgi:hypothetical protein
VLEDRTVPSVLEVGADQTFKTIQAAVTAAQSNDTILVDPGTYKEQVLIDNTGHSRDNLTIEGSGQNSTFIQAPTLSGVNHNAIVEISGAQNVTIENFTIEGPSGVANSGGELFGIRVDNGGSATITQNHITKIEDTPFGGVQEGIAIDVGRASDGTTGTAIISYNTIDQYQKGGILVDNAGSSAEINHNTIIGAGPTTAIAQNGIQISRGATADVSYNNISGNEYTPDPQATGILLFSNPVAVTVTHNVLSNNDYGIALDTVAATPTDHVNFNVISGSTVAGLLNDNGSGTLDATNNYWNSPTGPTNPNNPGGVGQTIIDSRNGASGTGIVNFAPFLTSSTTTAVSNAAATFSESNQNVTLTADVSSIIGEVNEGTVTFTVLQGSTVIGSSVTSGTVSNGQASAVFVLPGGVLSGSYTISAVYNPGPDFTGSSGTASLTVNPAATTAQLTNVSIVPNLLGGTAQVTMTAQVNSSAGSVNEGSVTFTFAGHSVQGNVVNGTASGQLTLSLLNVIGNQIVSFAYADSGTHAAFGPGGATTGVALNVWNARSPANVSFTSDNGQLNAVQFFLAPLEYFYTNQLLTEFRYGMLDLHVGHMNIGGQVVVTLNGVPWQVQLFSPQGQFLGVVALAPSDNPLNFLLPPIL